MSPVCGIFVLPFLQELPNTVDTADKIDSVPGQDVYGVDMYIPSRGAAQGLEGVGDTIITR